MDVRMPVMDGLEAMRRMRAIEGLNAVPIIAVSAGAMTDDKARSLAAGATAFLSKPVDHDTLMQPITTHLRQSGSAHVCTPFTNTHLVSRLLLAKKQTKK